MGLIIGNAIGIPFKKSNLAWIRYWATRTVTGVTITVDSDTQFTVNWTNNGTIDYTGHKAYISTDSVTFTLNKTVASVGISMILTGLTAGTLYYVKIAPYKDSNVGNLSDYAVDITTAATLFSDGNTKGSYYGKNYSTITKNAAYQISQINDVSGNSYHLGNLNADDTKPILVTDGIYFDGINDYIKGANISFNQPTYIYLVMKIPRMNTGANGNTYIDGWDGTHRGVLGKVDSVSATEFYMTSGSVVNTGMVFTIGNANIYRIVFNGASSKLKINDLISADLNTGTHNMGAIVLGSNYTQLVFGCMQLTEAHFRQTNANESLIYNYLYNKYFKDRVHNIVWEGHSMINPIETGLDIALPDHTKTYLKVNHKILTFPTTNIAVGGAKIADLVSRKATSLTPLKSSVVGIKNIVIVFIGTNDVITSVGSGTTAYNALHSYIDGLITDGWTPVIITMTKAELDPARETERNAYNNAIKANDDWDYILDVDTIPELVDNTNTDYFNADMVHLVNAGNLILGRYLAAKIAEIP